MTMAGQHFCSACLSGPAGLVQGWGLLLEKGKGGQVSMSLLQQTAGAALDGLDWPRAQRSLPNQLWAVWVQTPSPVSGLLSVLPSPVRLGAQGEGAGVGMELAS